jgi:hypothetical protein
VGSPSGWIKLALRERSLKAGLGCLEGVLVVLVVTRHCELGGSRTHAGDSQHRDNDEQ